MSITVVVPTFNRARLLARTIPTYLQEGVERLIIIDDASVDDTQGEARKLASRFPGIVHHVRNDVNRKQAFSKNLGKSLATSDYVYFGDDDSVLVPGSMSALLETMQERHADIVGAAAPYCTNGATPEEAYQRYLQSEPVRDASSIVNLARLQARFWLRPSDPLRVPVTHAAFLIRREWYARIDFDLRYTGNCYREETDFLLQACCAGARIFIDGRAVQINLPPADTKGGARGFSRSQYEWYSFSNTARFLRKHRNYFRCELRTSIFRVILLYVMDRIAAAAGKLSA